MFVPFVLWGGIWNGNIESGIGSEKRAGVGQLGSKRISRCGIFAGTRLYHACEKTLGGEVKQSKGMSEL